MTPQNLEQEWQVLNKNSLGYLVSRQDELGQYQLRVVDLIGVFGKADKQRLELLKVGFIRWLKTTLMV